MCIFCDGASIDEVRFTVYGDIQTYGWHIVYVDNRKRSASWAYTIGLSSGFDHPELAVVGVDANTAGWVLNSIGEHVKEGERLGDGDVVVTPDRSHLHLVEVHPHHFDGGTFASWVDYYETLGPPPPEPRALEVVMRGRQPRLTHPELIPPVRSKADKALRSKRPPRTPSHRRTPRSKKRKPRHR